MSCRTRPTLGMDLLCPKASFFLQCRQLMVMSMSPPPEPAEFDRFARDYDALLRDPLRDGFAGDKSFFMERKLDVILRALQSQNLDTHSLRWLDVGCGRGELLRLGQSY